MARYGKESKLSPDKVMEKALEFFGPDGFVQVCEGGKGSEVDLETREWDYQVKQFMGKI
jgi:hypothetical protein